MMTPSITSSGQLNKFFSLSRCGQDTKNTKCHTTSSAAVSTLWCLTVFLTVVATSFAQTVAYIGPSANPPGTTGVYLANPNGSNAQLVNVNLVGLGNIK